MVSPNRCLIFRLGGRLPITRPDGVRREFKPPFLREEAFVFVTGLKLDISPKVPGIRYTRAGNRESCFSGENGSFGSIGIFVRFRFRQGDFCGASTAVFNRLDFKKLRGWTENVNIRTHLQNKFDGDEGIIIRRDQPGGHNHRFLLFGRGISMRCCKQEKQYAREQ